MTHPDGPLDRAPTFSGFTGLRGRAVAGGAAGLASDPDQSDPTPRFATAARRLPPSAWSLSAPLNTPLPLPMFRVSARGRILSTNDAALRLFGLPDDADLAGLPVRVVCPDQSMRRWLARAMGVNGQLDGVEADFVHASGRRLRLQVYACPGVDEAGEVFVEGALFDVTSRELAIAELEGTKRRLLSFFERSPVGYWVEDFSALGAWLGRLRSEGVSDLRAHLDENPDELRFALDLVRIVDVNAAALSLVGAREKSAILETGLSSVVDDDALDVFREQVVALWEGKSSLQSVGRGMTLDGDPLEYVLTWVITLDDGPQLGSVVVSVEDVTELRKASRRLAAVEELKDHFVRSLSHELRNPLAGVFGFVELIRENWSSTSAEELGEYLEVLAAESAVATDVLDNLVIAVQLATQPSWSPRSAPADLAEIDLNGIALETVSTLEPRLSQPACVVGEPTWAVGNRDWLGLIVRNLVNNAIRHGGSSVTVTTADSGTTSRLVVADDGDGIPSDVVDQAFEVLVGRPTHPGLSDPLGFGLAVSRALARAMGGDLKYGREGGSSEFTLELPSAKVSTR